MANSNFKRAVETILIASGNQSVIADGSTALVSSTGACNLASGQLGVFSVGLEGSATNGTAINTGDSIVEAPQIVVACGTPSAALPGPSTYEGFFNKTHFVSHRIYGALTKVWKGHAYVAGRLNAWVIGADNGATDAIGTPLDLTDYSIRVTFKSRKHDESYGLQTRDSIVATYTTPDYTTLGTVNPLDHLVQNLVSILNKNSRAVVTNGRRGSRPFVAFAVNTGSTGSFSGSGEVLLSSLVSLDGGVSTGYGFSTDAETAAANNNSQMGATFTALVADTAVDIDSDSEVVPISLTTAGTNTIGANSIVIMALDALPTYDDRIPELKVDLDVSLKAGFASTVGIYDSSILREELWNPRRLKMYFRDTQGLRNYSQNRIDIPIVEIPSPDDLVSSTEIYDVYVLESFDPLIEAIQADNQGKHRLLIFVPNASTTTKNGLEAVMNTYLGSAGLPAVNL